MTTPTINIPLLRKAVEWVEEQAALPREGSAWNQESWMSKPVEESDGGYCNTAMCIAGAISHWAGWKPVWVDTQVENRYYADSAIKDGVEKAIEVIAADELGLEYGEKDYLFRASNDAASIRSVAERIAGEAL